MDGLDYWEGYCDNVELLCKIGYYDKKPKKKKKKKK